ncbi:hypothetical protein EYC84_001079 [Monilinia fructicola]|uniref:Uncharacterized protein n=1 Tax=Monilinia fructicola TaxID=38448 RepID=A0A5M9JJ10_MONFR|nr:hypothetical protein EYC84_001079 [Monilinia fructicola]
MSIVCPCIHPHLFMLRYISRPRCKNDPEPGSKIHSIHDIQNIQHCLPDTCAKRYKSRIKRRLGTSSQVTLNPRHPSNTMRVYLPSYMQYLKPKMEISLRGLNGKPIPFYIDLLKHKQLQSPNSHPPDKCPHYLRRSIVSNTVGIMLFWINSLKERLHQSDFDEKKKIKKIIRIQDLRDEEKWNEQQHDSESKNVCPRTEYLNQCTISMILELSERIKA